MSLIIFLIKFLFFHLFNSVDCWFSFIYKNINEKHGVSSEPWQSGDAPYAFIDREHIARMREQIEQREPHPCAATPSLSIHIFLDVSDLFAVWPVC